MSYMVIFFILIFLILLASLAFMVLTGIWIYKDSQLHGQSPLLWLVIFIVVSPFIGLLLYFIIARKEISSVCPSCGNFMKKTASFCDNCGTEITGGTLPDKIIVEKTKKNKKFLISGIISAIATIMMAVILIIYCIAGAYKYENSGSDGLVFGNTSRHANYFIGKLETNLGHNKWTLKFSSAGYGSESDTNLKIKDSEQNLIADIQCGEGELLMKLKQDEIEKIVDVSNLTEPYVDTLEEFHTGKIRITLISNGAKKVSSKIVIEDTKGIQ